LLPGGAGRATFGSPSGETPDPSGKQKVPQRAAAFKYAFSMIGAGAIAPIALTTRDG
jgi:hypothetical protein